MRTLSNRSMPPGTFIPVNAHHAHAAKCGATILSLPADLLYGERQYGAEDPGGHRWVFTQSIADVHPSAWGGLRMEGADDDHAP